MTGDRYRLRRNAWLATLFGGCVLLLVAAAPVGAEPTGVSVGDAGQVAEGDVATFRISIDSVSNADLTFGYNLGGTAGKDDVGPALPSPATIRRGQLFVDVLVPTKPDLLDENDESLTLNLQTSPVPLKDLTGAATIVDDDTASIAVPDVKQPEGTGSGTTRFSFEVVLDGESSTDVVLAWQATAATAVPSEDFGPAGGQVQWRPGQNGVRTVSVDVVRDAKAETDETFKLDLRLTSGVATIARGSAVGTIVNDDAGTPAPSPPPPPPPAGPGLSIGDGVVNEGASSIPIEVTLTPAAQQTVTVQFEGQASATGPSATPGADFTLQAGTLTFSPGETKKTITAAVANDTVPEPDETFRVVLKGQTPTSVKLAAATATVKIVDNDSSSAGRLPFVVPTRPATLATPVVTPIKAKPVARKKKRLQARVLSVRMDGRLNGLRRARIGVTLNQNVTARLVLLQGKRSVKSSPFTLRAGNRGLYVVLPPNVARGRVVFRLQLTTATNRRVVLQTKLLLTV